MESVEWIVDSGEWRVWSGEWIVESGEWRVESGEWKMGYWWILKMFRYCGDETDPEKNIGFGHHRLSLSPRIAPQFYHPNQPALHPQNQGSHPNENSKIM